VSFLEESARTKERKRKRERRGEKRGKERESRSDFQILPRRGGDRRLNRPAINY